MDKQTIVLIGKLSTRSKMNHIVNENRSSTLCGDPVDVAKDWGFKEYPAAKLSDFPIHCKKCLNKLK